MRRLIVFASLFALVATACQIETNFEGIINADGSGKIITEVGFDDEAAEFFLGEGADPFGDSPFSDDPRATTREEVRGDMTFYITEVEVDTVEEIEALLLAQDDAILSEFDITVTDDLVSVTGRASAEQAFGDDFGEFDPALIEDSLSANVRLTLPGAITSHNADSQSGNTLTWEVPLFGGDLVIDAQSDPTGSPAGDGGGFPVWLIAVIAIAVLGAGWWYMNNKGKGAGATPATETTPAATATEDGTPPPPPPAE
jgi:hypothetical protein